MDTIFDTARDSNSLLARRPRLQSESPGTDADMLDMIAKFEQNFAELQPARKASQVDLTDLVLDDTFSILTVAQTQGTARAQQAAADTLTADLECPLPQPDLKPELHREHSAAGTQANVAARRIGWTTGLHKRRSLALAGGVLALALALSVGYIAGRAPHGKSHTFIETTVQGGMLLRLDPNLGKR